MKAIRVHKFGGPEVLQLDDVAEPVAGPGQVLVQIRAAGVNPVDTYIRSGTYAQSPALPYVPGGDAAGTVKACGAGVSRFRPGDRVWVARAAGYADVVIGDTVVPAAAWTYRRPSAGFEAIAGWWAFYAQLLDERWLDSERVVANPGSFYGGWITANVTGPFKGGPGTSHW